MLPLFRLLSSARLFAFLLLWLMAILVMGTVAEKTGGLYAAEQRYFSSYVIWTWGFLPLPGLLSATGFLFVGLMARLGLEEWKWKRLGSITIHIGAALLLFGGSVTAWLSREGIMVIPEGQARSYIEDLRHVELAVSELDGERIVSESIIPENRLASGDLGGSPLDLRPVGWCRNCGLIRLPAAVSEGDPHGVAINFVLKEISRDPQDEKNRAGLTFRLAGTDGADGLYAIFEEMPIPEIVTVREKRYWLTLRHARTPLPFAIGLTNFREELYPGTTKPRAYESDVVVNDGGVLWPSSIRMNEPLRYRGYTFYQSSFLQGTGESDTTILAVVENAGRLFPYLSGGIVGLGFVIHLWQRFASRRHEALP